MTHWTVHHVTEDVNFDENENPRRVNCDYFSVVRYVGGEDGWESHPLGEDFESREEAQQFADNLNMGYFYGS